MGLHFLNLRKERSEERKGVITEISIYVRGQNTVSPEVLEVQM